MVVLANYL
ncbi:uncharacterized protein FFNC_03071 [Fusarium fujikuroi]|nr:uncharacterized protein FFNC_03071 [Fusarium fujikuroi]